MNQPLNFQQVLMRLDEFWAEHNEQLHDESGTLVGVVQDCIEGLSLALKTTLPMPRIQE